ncbi:hypothetical protein ACROYT_G021810 [Oculina patagonica]
MGNGANSRPENPVVMQPTARPVPQANGYGSSSGYVANGGDTYGGRLQPHYGSHSQYTGDPAFRNGWGSQHSGSYDSNYYGNYGVNQNVERSIAPYSSSNSRSPHRKERHDRNYRDSSTSHQSALSSHHHSKRATTNGQYRSGNQRANKAERNANSTSDDILFEDFHCDKTGRDYSVINVDGMRYLVDSWNTGARSSASTVLLQWISNASFPFILWCPSESDFRDAGRFSTLKHVTNPAPSSASDELRPVPEEWYQHGNIESNERPGTVHYMYGEEPNGAAPPDDTWVPRWEDDRMGIMDHPHRGLLNTYFEETKLNVLNVYDNSSGTWLKMPLSWELYITDIKSHVAAIQEAFPDWDDQFEILALLRQCNYDLDEVTNTYITLLADDTTGKEVKSKHKSSSGSSKEHAAENELLKEKIEQLEEQLREKDSKLQDSQRANADLQAKLKSSDDMVRKLQIKGTSLQREIQQLKSAANPSSPTSTAYSNSSSCFKRAEDFKRYLSKHQVDSSALFSDASGIKELFYKRNARHCFSLGSSSKLFAEVLQRKLLYNKLQELRGNIRVFCRCRYDPSADNVMNFTSDQDLSLVSAQGQKKTFRFDRVFSPSSTQEEVFQDTLPLITSCVDGYNVCILAYGQTGAGKTYTMMGTDQDPGVNIRSILELLRVCDERTNVDYSMCVSMVEVYNETVRDLLSENSSSQQLNIQMRNKQLVITDVTEVEVKSAADIKSIMQKGDMNRSVGATKMNTNSSRSHLLLLLRLQGTDHVTNAVTRGTLTLVDLAGSERISKTEATGQRLVEAAAINKSLSALGQVFAALRTNAMHVPYRNSKLTQLMQNSLGGDGKACMFVNVSPLASNLSETVSTLQFGSAAKQVELGKATQNITQAPKRN